MVIYMLKLNAPGYFTNVFNTLRVDHVPLDASHNTTIPLPYVRCKGNYLLKLLGRVTRFDSLLKAHGFVGI